MPRSVANKNYRTFVQGLITEASPLTYPENASLAEDNLILFRKGNRTRRLGFEAEPESQTAVTFSNPTARIREYSWEAVNETGEVDLLVQRVGNLIYFFDNNEETISRTQLPTVIDLRNFKSTSSTAPVESSRVSFTSGRGYLFVVGDQIEPFSVEYVSATQLVARQINIRIRDFVGVDDGLANDFEPTTLSKEHLYNLRNQGWVSPSSKTGNTSGDSTNLSYDTPFSSNLATPFIQGISVPFTSDPITKYKAQIGTYPGNNKAWWLGRIEVANPEAGLKAGDFDPDVLCDTFVGNTLAARGHFILDAFIRDRETVGDVDGIPTESSASRPNSTGFYSGRVWYGHESDVYYSQTLRDYRQAGNCYQEADPTSETISDLIATDGGLIPIPEAFNIKRLYPLGGGILVFADNGLWFVSGGSNNGFSATDISVSKVSSNGILGPDSLVEANGVIYWWSAAGIMSMSQNSGAFGPVPGSFQRVNIAEQTILSFYNNRITPEAKEQAKGVYDPARNLIIWLYKSRGQREANVNAYDRILNLDVTLSAFYPWSIAETTENYFLTGVFPRTRIKQIETPGINSQEGVDVFNSYVKFGFARRASNGRYNLSFGDFQDQNYTDFDSGNYLSFMETGYEILEDLMRDKQSNYVYLYFRRTDDERFDTESSCLFQTKWDWSRNEASNRWSRKVEGYRVTSRFSDATVVSTKHKARGHGRALQVRFECNEPNKTFDLLGWATHYTGETTV